MYETEKIVQITATGVQETQFTQCESYLFALTDAGRVYFTDNRQGFQEWTEAKTTP